MVNLDDRGHEPIKTTSGLRRQSDQRRSTHLRQLPVEGLPDFGKARLRILDQVPFCENKDDRPPFPLDQIGDLEILDFKRVGGVHDKQHHLCEGDGPYGVCSGKLFQPLLNLRLTAQTCGVHQSYRPPVPGPVHGDRIPGDPRLRTRQETILSDQAVDQCRLPRIWTPHDGDPQRPLIVGKI